MSKRWIASGTILILGLLILMLGHFGITNLDPTLLFWFGVSTFVTGLILISFAFGLSIFERL
jgi:hypothetical protein